MSSFSKHIILGVFALAAVGHFSNDAKAQTPGYKLQYSCAGFDSNMPLYRLSGSVRMVHCRHNGYSTIAVGSCENPVHIAGSAPDGRSVAILLEAITPERDQARLCIGAAGISDSGGSAQMNQAFGAVDQRTLGQACDGAVSVKLNKDFDILATYGNASANNGVAACRLRIY